MTLLEPDRVALLADARRTIADLRAVLARLPASTDDQEVARQSFLDLDNLFLLVVAGEFNSGKSALINALLGETVLPEGVTPTTRAVTVVRYSAEPYERWLSEAQVERGYPSRLLKQISYVDTPGTNAVIREHQVITEQFVPRSDLVLFVTSADRPFTESERLFLERIREWGKKVVLVVNKVDLLEGAAEVDEVVAFVRENAARLLSTKATVFPISARWALRAKQLPPGAARDKAWGDSRFEPFERFVRDSLDDEERFRLKLLNPLGTADRLIGKYQNQTASELEALWADTATLEQIDRQIQLEIEDTAHDFRMRLSDLELILHRMADRGQQYLNQTIRLTRVFDLVNTDRVRAEFERVVVGDTAVQVEEAVRGLSDWLVEREQRLWRAAVEQLERRRAVVRPDAPGPGESRSNEDRRQLVGAFVSTARRALAGYDKEGEAERLAQSVRGALAQTAVAEVGALGLGALVVGLATTAAVDVTGLLAAGLVAGLGFFILPARRRRAREEFLRKIDDLRRRLVGAIDEEYHRAMERTRERVREAMGPYRRFVLAERERTHAEREALHDLATAVVNLRRRVG